MSDHGDCAGCGDGCATSTDELAVRPSRPGLAELPYRVGNRAAFLDSAVRRLSRITVRDPDTRAELHPLRALTARGRDDLTQALLDAWACAADVLTFYTERIANEGYLRTATERRSVVELGGLLGYRPRPGLAATAWLSYGVEVDAGVTIPAGSAVQSTPGPGELPQTFETADDLDARGEWNELPLRRTAQPDVTTLEPVATGATVELAVAGTPVLAPGDMVLADTGGARVPLRVVATEPGADGTGTRLTLGAWTPTASVDRTDLAERMAATLRESADLAAAGVEPRVTAQRVVDALDELAGLVTAAAPADVLLTHLADVTLELVREQLRRDRLRPTAGPLRRWLRAVVADLEELERRFAGPAAAASADAAVATIGGALADLARPASVPPADPARLVRRVDQALGAGSDALPALLAAARPELRPTLYQAWAQVPAGPPSPLRLHALTTRAGLFGATAPEQPVLDRAGTVVGTREWTLERPGPQAGTEEFRVDLEVPQDLLVRDVADDEPVTVAVTVGPAAGQLAATVRDLRDGPLTVPLDPGDTVATVTLTEDQDTALEIALPQHDLRLVATVRPFGNTLAWESRGADPAAVRFEAVTDGGGDGDGRRVARLRATGTHPAAGQATPTEQRFVARLDGPYAGILPGSFVVLDRPPGAQGAPGGPVVATVVEVTEAGFTDYGVTGRGSRVVLDAVWLAPDVPAEPFGVIRGSTVHAGSRPLELLPSPLDPVVDALCGGELPLDALLDGLLPGRWLVVAGERTDILAATGTRVPGVRATELVMVGGVRQEVAAGPDARTRTVIDLATPLAYCYRRDTVVVLGNVVRATHGQSALQTLGRGDATKAHQRFALAHTPLTHLASPADGTVEPALDVRVDGVRWFRVDSLVEQPPTAHRWQLTDTGGQPASVLFGDGVEGARLPTGQENVVASYRWGLGRAGNLDAGRLDLPTTRPQGVQTVTNPLPATGGADPDGRDDVRRRIPQSVLALDRVVSLEDYAGFALTFPGIAKARADRVPDGRREAVHVTVALEDDAPLDPRSDLYRALRAALLRHGDPDRPLRLARRARRTLVIAAGVALEPDGVWETVSAAVRAVLDERFGFAARGLVQDVVRGEVVAAIQAVPQVGWVDLDVLDAIDEDALVAELTQPGGGGGVSGLLGLRHRVRARPARPTPGPPPAVLPAQIVAVAPQIPDTVLLREIR